MISKPKKIKEYLSSLNSTVKQILFVTLVLYLAFSILDQLKPKWLDFHYNPNYLIIAMILFGFLYAVLDFALSKIED